MKRKTGAALITAAFALTLALTCLGAPFSAFAVGEDGTGATGEAGAVATTPGDSTDSTDGGAADEPGSPEAVENPSAPGTDEGVSSGSEASEPEAPATEDAAEIELNTAEYKATPSYVLSADEKNIDISVLLPYDDVNKVYFAVWSRQAVNGNAQDDIVWYEAKKQSDGTWTVNVPLDKHHSTGQFDIHCYAQVNGSMQFVGNNWFLVDKPTGTFEITSVDTAKGTYTVTLKDITCFQGIVKVQVPSWVNDDQSDIKWYTATKNSDGTYSFTVPMSDHSWTSGTYRSHCYILDGNGAMTCVGNLTQPMTAPAASFTVNIASNESSATIKATIPYNATRVQFPVWSDKNGQDDIVWYEAKKQSDGTWAATVPINKHKGTGLYRVHCYATVDGSLVCVGNTTFSITPPTATVTVTPDATTGTYTVKVEGINCPAGVKKVQIPTWVNDDQSDIKWYTATKQSDGSYTYTVPMADHGWKAGTYRSHVYITDGNGTMTCVGGVTQAMTVPTGTVTATVSADEMTVHLTAVVPMSGVTTVKFPAWSNKNGQDDIVWYAGKKQSDGTWAVDMPVSSHRTAGEYQVHCYATTGGKQLFVGNTTFNISAPTGTMTIESVDTDAGTYTVRVSGITSPSGVSMVQLPTWVTDNQSDIKWYRAQATDTPGEYTFTVTMGGHQWLTGTYRTHCYVTGNNGVMGMIGSGTQVMDLPAHTIYATISADEKSASIYAVAPGASNVKFPVWSEKGGQDDLKWYSATQNSQGLWIATVPISNHKTDGKYQVHGYANNNKDFVGGTSFNVTPITGSITVQNIQPKKGTFDVIISNLDSPSGVTRVQVPIWTASDQSDIHWYEATRQSDGTWKVTMNIGRHGYHDGTFQIHCYVTGGNGVKSCIGGTKQYMDVVDYINVTGTPGSGQRTIILKDPSVPASSIQFPVWSATGGQDDIRWYTATNQGNGLWVATVSCASLKHEGQCIVHCYANGSTLLTATTFDIIREDLVADLTGCYIMINKQACCITVYTAAGVPVKAFICSPGDATPLGTFYSPAKYRWKELIGPSWGQYCTRITNGFLIHSVGGSAPNPYSISASDYNALGSRVSHGCVRVTVADAKWIYDNCAPGVRITIYESPDPGPLGKPGHIIIPSWQNWDPTDPSCPENW